MATEAENRYFCSNLVTVRLAEGEGTEHVLTGNLEEISTSGARLNVEEPVEYGQELRVVCAEDVEAWEFRGRVAKSDFDAQTGYHLSVDFDEGVEWAPGIYRPKHMMRADMLASDDEPEVNCCERGVCPKEVIARVLEPELPMSDRVRAVGREVAALCGDLTENDAASCFGSLFGAGPGCRLFGEFRMAYAEQRRKGPGTKHKDLRSHVEKLVRLAGGLPAEALESESCAPWVTPVVPPQG